jgi:hypothetical protein
MDFRRALQANSVNDRDALIEHEIYDEDWCEYLTELPNGGWVEEAPVYDIQIDDTDEETIIVTFRVEYNELVQFGCSNIDPQTEPTKIQFFMVTIDKKCPDRFEVELTDDDRIDLEYY